MTDLIREINEKPKILEEWYQEHKAEFVPPICNRLMHKNQMTVIIAFPLNKFCSKKAFLIVQCIRSKYPRTYYYNYETCSNSDYTEPEMKRLLFNFIEI